VDPVVWLLPAVRADNSNCSSIISKVKRCHKNIGNSEDDVGTQSHTFELSGSHVEVEPRQMLFQNEPEVTRVTVQS